MSGITWTIVWLIGIAGGATLAAANLDAATSRHRRRRRIGGRLWILGIVVMLGCLVGLIATLGGPHAGNPYVELAGSSKQ